MGGNAYSHSTTMKSQMNRMWSSQFDLNSHNSQTGIAYFEDRHREDVYLCRKLSSFDKEQIQDLERLMDIKQSIQSPYVTKLQKARIQRNYRRQFECCYEGSNNYYLMFKKPFQTLKQEALSRKNKGSCFSETEIEVLLEIGVKALSLLELIDHPHGRVSSEALFITENRTIVLGDPWIFPSMPKSALNQNGYIYPSPQALSEANERQTPQNNSSRAKSVHRSSRQKERTDRAYSQHLSDLFTFGLVLLELFYLMKMDVVYQKQFLRVNYEAVNEKLSGIRNIELRKKLYILLDHQPHNRKMIYKYFSKKVPVRETFQKKPREKFIRTIERYNLATSEVTEWIDEFPHQVEANTGHRNGHTPYQIIHLDDAHSNPQKILNRQLPESPISTAPYQSRNAPSISLSATKTFSVERFGDPRVQSNSRLDSTFQNFGSNTHGYQPQIKMISHNCNSIGYPPPMAIRNSHQNEELGATTHKNSGSSSSTNSSSAKLIGSSQSWQNSIDTQDQLKKSVYLADSHPEAKHPQFIVNNEPSLQQKTVGIPIQLSKAHFNHPGYNVEGISSKDVQFVHQKGDGKSVKNSNEAQLQKSTAEPILQDKSKIQKQEQLGMRSHNKHNVSEPFPKDHNFLQLSDRPCSAELDLESDEKNYIVSNNQRRAFTTEKHSDNENKSRQSQLPLKESQKFIKSPQKNRRSSSWGKRLTNNYSRISQRNPLLSTINERSQRTTDSAISDDDADDSQKFDVMAEKMTKLDFIDWSLSEAKLKQNRGRHSENFDSRTQSNVSTLASGSFTGEEIKRLSERSIDRYSTREVEDQQQNIYTINYKSGAVYEGQLKSNQREGYGTYYYSDQSRYIGEWKNNKMHGFGRLYYPSGQLAYEGQWERDNFHGKGKVFNDHPKVTDSQIDFTDLRGIIEEVWVTYEGDLFNYEKQGRGVLQLSNGDSVKGEFHNDMLNGMGQFYSKKNGLTISGLWENNILIQR